MRFDGNSRALRCALVCVLGLVSWTACPQPASPVVSFAEIRHAFCRGEEMKVRVDVTPPAPEMLQGATLTLKIGEWTSPSQRLRPGDKGAQFRVPTAALKSGGYAMTATLLQGETTLAEASDTFTLAMPPHPDRLLVWLWGGGGSQWYLDHGFTTLTGVYAPSPGKTFGDADRQTLDQGLPTGAAMGLFVNGGLRDVDPTQIPDPDAVFQGVRSHEATPIANPYHPEVARLQDATNRSTMEFVQDYPQVKTAFFNTEVVDALEINRNEEGLRLFQKEFGDKPPEAGPPKFVLPGVIADDDPSYLLHKYLYKKGNGLALANLRTVEMIHRYRPDVLTITDPYRQTALLDLMPGLDVVGTWTYTNPDPKLMLYIETLRAACKPSGQIPLNTVTLLNYPGELTPGDEWTLMGPDCAKETTWINLSRAPKIVGYYYSSACDPQQEQSERVPYETSLAIKELAEKVFKPYGPMITQLQVSPRRIAVLSSAAARVHGKSPTLRGGYDNFQIYHFYTLLAMNHLQADVVFDETIERFGLDDYDTLVLPKCDVLTESVYREVLRFAERGGVLIADQYLGPELPGVLNFDFDFTYRERVNAKAVAENKVFAQWNDQLQPDSAELKEVTGVTALDDQRIMEAYAVRLREGLKGVVEPDITCDEPTVLLNRLEYGGAQYLVVVNDKREYDDRVGKYKGILGRLTPQDAVLTMKGWPHDELCVYDMLARKRLDAGKHEGTFSFRVPLGDLGGALLALYPTPLSGLIMLVPENVPRNHETVLSVSAVDSEGALLPGLQPMHVAFTAPDGKEGDFSGYYCAENGLLRLPFTIALNDSGGPWIITVEDLTAGQSTSRTFTVSN